MSPDCYWSSFTSTALQETAGTSDRYRLRATHYAKPVSAARVIRLAAVRMVGAVACNRGRPSARNSHGRSARDPVDRA